MASMDTDGVWPCTTTTTTLTIKLGSQYDPMVARPTNQVKLWANIWNHIHSTKEEMVAAKASWKSAYVAIAIPSHSSVINSDATK